MFYDHCVLLSLFQTATHPNITLGNKKKIKRGNNKKWYFVTKIVLTYCEKKKCSSDREKLLKFEAEGQEFRDH